MARPPVYEIRVLLDKHGAVDVYVTCSDPTKHQPDVLADLMRHAVTAVGGVFPEDLDEDLLDELHELSVATMGRTDDPEERLTP